MASTPNSETPSGSQGPNATAQRCSRTSCSNTGTLRCARCKTSAYCSTDCQKQHWRNGHRERCHPKAPSNALENYVLRIQLGPEQITAPPIIRELSCPAKATFHQLHRALQITFSWATTHTYDFIFKDPSSASSAEDDDDSMEALIQRLTSGIGHSSSESPGIGKPYLLRLTEPRRRQPGGVHPNAGAIDFMHDRMRRNDDSPTRMSTDVLLCDILEDERYKGKTLEYCYDFGDSGGHDIKLVARRASTTAFECLSGQGHAAAEDAGSYGGWEELVKAYRAQRPSQEQEEKISWYEEMCSNGDAMGLKGSRIDDFDKDGINQKLQGQGYLV